MAPPKSKPHSSLELTLIGNSQLARGSYHVSSTVYYSVEDFSAESEIQSEVHCCVDYSLELKI